MQYQLQEAANRCQAYLTNIALPFWEKSGVIHRKLGFVENFNLKTQQPNLYLHRRLRMQARQTWVFAKAANMRLSKNAHAIAESGWQVIHNHYKSAQGGYIFSVNKDGKPTNTARFLYEQAFVLLALSELYNITKSDRYLDDAEQLYNWLNQSMRADDGFWTKLEDRSLPREQNPHMHLFEALMFLYEASKQKQWLDRASEIYGLFHQFFFDFEHRLLREFFSLSFSGYDINKGNIIEPGHNFEWVWLLHRFGKLTGFKSETQDALYAFGLKGTTEQGIVVDQCDADGNITQHTSKLWAQTEALKAHIAQYETYRKQEHMEAIIKTVDNIFQYYLRLDGLWGDKLDKQLQETSEICPATSFYHIFLAMIEVIRLANKESMRL